MKHSILLTGANGQIGRELSWRLKNIGDVTACDRRRLDLTNASDIRAAVRSVRPDLIVNAAAYTAVDQAETDRATARIVNVEAPAILAEEAKKAGALLIHYSTDYVFDGAKTEPYVETDLPNPLNVYGKTKLEGERAIENSGAAHLIFRSSWVYAREGQNFLLKMLQLATQREELKIVSDQVGAPTWSAEIAKATMRVLDSLYDGDATRPAAHPSSGTYHMSSAGWTSWYEFAKAIFEEASDTISAPAWVSAATGGAPLIVRRLVPITTAEFATPARRPSYSVLSNARLAQTFGVHLPEWRTQLRAIFSSD